MTGGILGVTFGGPPMPLRDHFDQPPGRRPTWDRVHGGWPMVIAQHLFRVLPSRYHIAPQVHIAQQFEADVAAYDTEAAIFGASTGGADDGGVATVLVAPPEPTLTLETDVPDQDEYELRIYDAGEGERLVAVIEFVSPANKDRPESREAFVSKCHALLQQDVCVSIVDVVTTRQSNLYAELLESLGRSDPATGSASLYAVTVRRRTVRPRWRLDLWPHALRVGQSLPAIPIWLNDRDGTMLDLETTYEETCRTLRVA